MAIHILGNGPSIKFFDREEWPDSDVFVGCNFSDESLRPDYTVIVDVRAMKQFRVGKKYGYRLNIPAVISERANKYIAEDTGGWEKMADGMVNVIEVMPTESDKTISKRLAMNSGQHGVIHSIRNNPEEDTIHIWGTDSFWSDDIVSSTDKIVRPNHKGPRVKPRITTKWMRYWRKILRDHPRYNFIVHCPMGSVLSSAVTEGTTNIVAVEHKQNEE